VYVVSRATCLLYTTTSKTKAQLSLGKADRVSALEASKCERSFFEKFIYIDLTCDKI